MTCYMVRGQFVANGKFDLSYDQIDSVCKVHGPKKRLSKKEVKISSKPGITKEIFAKMKYSDNLYSKLLKSKQPNPNLHYLYKKFTNRVVKDMKDSKTKGMCFHLPHVHVHLLCRVGIRELVSWSVSI